MVDLQVSLKTLISLRSYTLLKFNVQTFIKKFDNGCTSDAGITSGYKITFLR